MTALRPYAGKRPAGNYQGQQERQQQEYSQQQDQQQEYSQQQDQQQEYSQQDQQQEYSQQQDQQQEYSQQQSYSTESSSYSTESSSEEAGIQLQDDVEYVIDEAQFFVSPTSPTYKEIEEYCNHLELADLRKEENRLHHLLYESQHKMKKLEKERHRQVSFLVSEFSDVIMHMIMLAEAPDDEQRLELMKTELRHMTVIIHQMEDDERNLREIWAMKRTKNRLEDAVKMMKMNMKMRNRQ